jgi:hypothetical protein
MPINNAKRSDVISSSSAFDDHELLGVDYERTPYTQAPFFNAGS